MFSYRIAEQLQRLGHDVTAAAESSQVARLPDEDLFALAQREQRAVVTENINDLLAIDRLYRQQARAHDGLILTSDRRFPRGAGASGRLVLARDAFLRTQPAEPCATSLVHWLQ